MKKIIIAGLTILNLLSAGIIMSQQPEVAAEQTRSISTEKESKKIIGTYKKRADGDILVDFSDYSYAIINHETGKYIFQPSCMGDWDMEFESFEDLKMAMSTYFDGVDVEIKDL